MSWVWFYSRCCHTPAFSRQQKKGVNILVPIVQHLFVISAQTIANEFRQQQGPSVQHSVPDAKKLQQAMLDAGRLITHPFVRNGQVFVCHRVIDSVQHRITHPQK
ncbi:hypothetical protein NPIL_155281 [Nephila pilipes]|uniref:Uncharacterized protein n=1 Tax=Nephila pilipes TaxID=299642 RepID=A0A8X6T6G6_NEPPI|nr:hypothetical protein NPIL_155281 [Nephila pilipes]